MTTVIPLPPPRALHDRVLSAFAAMHPVLQALVATLFTWGVTALGAGLVLLRQNPSPRTLDLMLGFAGGVMVAASFWSLLAPSIAMAGQLGGPAWLPAAAGFMAGGAFLRVLDAWLPHLHPGLRMDQAEGVRTGWQRSVLLTLAITLHNIPEGLAVGVAFGAVASGLPHADFAGAIALAVGIALQNFPEGTAVAMPLRREGMPAWRAFFWGQLSGMVEPLAGMAGAALVLVFQPMLPYALAFAAGAMIYVVVEEVIPESQASGHSDLATLGFMGGFTVMMVLDVALGG